MLISIDVQLSSMSETKCCLSSLPESESRFVKKKRHGRLIPRYDRAFEVVERVGEVAGQIENSSHLPCKLSKTYFEDDDPDINRSRTVPFSLPKKFEVRLRKYYITRLSETVRGIQRPSS